jgi:hypothetical protein
MSNHIERLLDIIWPRTIPASRTDSDAGGALEDLSRIPAHALALGVMEHRQRDGR